MVRPAFDKMARAGLLSFGIFLLSFVDSVVFAGSIDEGLVKLLQTEALPAWSRAGRIADDVEVNVTETNVDNSVDPNGDAKSVSRANRWTYCQNATKERLLVERFNESPPGTSTRIIANDRYVSWVLQLRPGGRYSFDSGRLSTQGNATNLDAVEKTYQWQVRAGVYIIGVHLVDLLDRSKFRLVEATPADNEVKKHAYLECEYIGKPNNERYLAGGESYWVRLDPSRSWMIVDAGIKLAPNSDMPTAVNQHVEYQETALGGLFPSRLEIVRIHPKGIGTQTFEFASPTRFARPDDEFFLPHYEISESVFDIVSPRSGTRWVWIGVLIAGAILALGFLWIRNRRAA